MKIGDRIRVCNTLETVLENTSVMGKHTLYWFKDETGRMYCELESTIEKI